MDNLTKEQRRKNMQAVKSDGTGIELALGKALREKGYRYRKNCKNITGKPDFVLRKYNLIIFCDSEFWHGKDWKKTVARIGTHKKYWHQKIENNIKRDKKVNRLLKKDGWKVLRFWGTQIIKETDKCIKKIEKTINK
ncbi:MAG: very short patch repair endonuclease [Elusimicrobia bacterium]|nr:very short patch repair endonuclease [Elusimicrobiota bacterium]